MINIFAIVGLRLVILSLCLFDGSAQDLHNKSPDLQTVLDDSWDKLPSGWILSNPPNETQVGREEIIEARITRNVTDELWNDLRGRGIPQLEKINKIGTRMKPELWSINDSFKIDPLFSPDTAERPIVGSFVQWEWKILPLKSGNQTLKLTVFAIIEIPPYKDHYVPVPVFEKIIRVKVNPFYTVESFLRTEWKWLITTIILPIVAFFIGRHFSKR